MPTWEPRAGALRDKTVMMEACLEVPSARQAVAHTAADPRGSQPPWARGC